MKFETVVAAIGAGCTVLMVIIAASALLAFIG